MANYATLKAAIDAVIKANGHREITGTVLNQTLNAMVNSLGANYQLAGVATPSTNPGTPDQNVFYLAFEAGTYTNFNATVLSAGISIFMWNGSWSSQTFYTIDATPTASSNNLVSSGAVFDAIKTDGSAYDVSAHFPTGGPNNDGKFTLEYILSNANTLIPTAWRKGGMSIRFVQSSDNNYVQFRCKTQTFSANPNDWYFEGDDTLADNPEYLRAITDSAGHLLAWIRVDGGIDWAVGVPKPVKDYVGTEIAKILNGSASTDIDGINKIIAFLDNFSTSDTLAELLATKVDKVEGKSLIDAEFAEGVSQTENPEFAEVHTDADNKVLYGVKQDGDFYFGAGIPSQIKEELDEKVDKEDGKSLIDEGVAASQSVIEDHEFMQVEVDSEDKILGGRKTDGTQFENMPIETPSVIIKSIDDPENRTFIGLDANKRIITYRDEYGVLHEEAGIKSPTIDDILGRESSVENFILYQIELLKRNSPYSLAYANSYNHLNIVPYNDVQQVVHPKILYFSEALFGHKFWGAVTPYPKGNTLMENPCIIYSDDGYNWYGIAGNPIALPPDTSNFRKYNSDTHLVYRNDTDKLECWYRYCDEDTLKESIKRKVSFDGYIWGEEETLISFDNNSVGNALSPCVNWNTNHYDVWVVKSYGNNNFAIDYYTTVTGYDFQFVRKIELNYIYNNEEFFVWHIDVIQDSGLFIIVAMCKSKTTDKWILFITTSQDNITYSTPEVIMVGSNRWDGQMYRSSIVKVGNEYFLYYSARDNGINKNYYTSLSVSNTLSNFVGKINLNF